MSAGHCSFTAHIRSGPGRLRSHTSNQLCGSRRQGLLQTAVQWGDAILMHFTRTHAKGSSSAINPNQNAQRSESTGHTLALRFLPKVPCSVNLE